MDMILSPSPLLGTINAIGSKSDIHRSLICAAIADKETEIDGLTFSDKTAVSDDVAATISCIEALGAKVQQSGRSVIVYPIQTAPDFAVFDCKESGSTLRFILPVACALIKSTQFTGSGRLPQRPICELISALRSGGVTFDGEMLPFKTFKTLSAGEFYIPGNISSQYISGLMMALCAVDGKSKIILTSSAESVGYIDMTVSTLLTFGADIVVKQGEYEINGHGRLISPGKINTDGDWSNAAFFLAAGVIGGDVKIKGLNTNSVQGDKKLIDILSRFGANVDVKKDSVKTTANVLKGHDIDISQIPDLFPILAVVAAFADGETRFTGTTRLRIKESDRIATVSKMLKALGGHVEENGDEVTVYGSKSGLCGGIVDGAGDHRIVMAASIAAAFCKEEVKITGAQAVIKSYPTFFEDLKSIGGKAYVI